MPQITNDGTQLALVFDHETFLLAGVAELQDTYVFLSRNGCIFEIVMSHLPLPGQAVTVSIFDVVSTVTPEGQAPEIAPFIPVVFSAPKTQEQEEEVENPTPEQQPEPEAPREETPPAEPEAPAAEAQQPEPEAPEQPEVETEPAVDEEPQKERVADRVARGEQVPLMDMMDEINADRAAGRTPDHEKASKRKGRKSRPAASA